MGNLPIVDKMGFIEPLFNQRDIILYFFLFSFLGWCMECVVIRIENGKWENRGFAKTPFCIIYGVGIVLANFIIQPFSDSYISLFLMGAVLATIFEMITAGVMLRIFHKLWWNYANKPFNYKGIICLESTIGWGFLALFHFAFLNEFILKVIHSIPDLVKAVMAILLVLTYGIDFMIQFIINRKVKHYEEQEEIENRTVRLP